MRNVTIVLAVLALAGPAYGATTSWTAGTATWHSDGSWSGSQPTSGDTAVINNGGTAQITGDANASYLHVGDVAGKGNVDMTGGTLDVGNVLWLGRYASPGGAEGYFDQSDGVVTARIIGIGGDNNSTKGTYVISGGSLNITATTIIGSSWSAVGRLKIVGTTPTSVYLHNLYMRNQTGTIEFVLNGDGDVRKVTCNGISDDNGVISLDDSAYSPYLGEKIDLIQNLGSGGVPTYTDMTIDNADWKLVDNGVDTIQAECLVPEPATLTLLGIGGLGVLIRRKRR